MQKQPNEIKLHMNNECELNTEIISSAEIKIIEIIKQNKRNLFFLQFVF